MGSVGAGSVVEGDLVVRPPDIGHWVGAAQRGDFAHSWATDARTACRGVWASARTRMPAFGAVATGVGLMGRAGPGLVSGGASVWG